MSSCYVQLGKIGDIVSILPIIQHEYRTTGQKPKLVVAAEYAHVLDPLDFVEAVIYPGSAHDLVGAIKMAKGSYGAVLIPQVFGNDYAIQRKCPGFQLDQWERCHSLHLWGKLSLEIPRSNAMPCCSGPHILVADHSQSSPFLEIDDLVKALADTFPSHHVVRLSSIRCESIWDLLVLYDAADLLVCIDTMHLHLSIATQTPVIALATDAPGRWRGSSDHPRFSFYCRYSDYGQRKEQLLRAAKRAVNKVERPKIVQVQSYGKHYYNHSIFKVGDKLWVAERYHPDPKSWRTQIALSAGDYSGDVVFPDRYKQHSHEDARLFMYQGKPHISATISRSPKPGEAKLSPCITGYGELTADGQVLNWTEPKVGKNDWTGQEKNFVLYDYQGKLHLIYQCSPEHVVYELSGAEVVREYRTKTPACSLGPIRGGTQPLPYKDGWIRFCHVNQTNKKSDVWWLYHVVPIFMDSKPPFQIRAIGQPLRTGDEIFYPGHKYFKCRISIPYGAIETDGGWLVSMGRNDSDCELMTVKKEMIEI